MGTEGVGFFCLSFISGYNKASLVFWYWLWITLELIRALAESVLAFRTLTERMNKLLHS